jgi:hypothetical protein
MYAYRRNSGVLALFFRLDTLCVKEIFDSISKMAKNKRRCLKEESSPQVPELPDGSL